MSSATPRNQLEQVSDRNEREVFDLLIKYLQKIEGTYSTTLEQDVEILEEIYKLNRPDQVNMKGGEPALFCLLTKEKDLAADFLTGSNVIAVTARLAEKKLLRAHILTLREEKAQVGTTPKEQQEYKINPNWKQEL